MAKNMANIKIVHFDKIHSISELLTNYSDNISNINWENFKPTQESLEQANVIFKTKMQLK